MYEIIQNFEHDIFAEKEGPFVSIYQNTHQLPKDVEQDWITFKNHLKTIETSLKEEFDDELIDTILEPLLALKHDKDFWNNNINAFALFANPKDFVVIRLSNKVKERAVVADSFHTKPLIRYFQNRGAFDVLTLDREHFALYTCTKEVCHKVAFEEGTPVTKEEVLGTLDEKSYLSHASYNGANSEAMYHGHEDNKDIIEKDTERYFRYVDQFINDTYSKPTKRSLVLWTLPEHHGVFRKITKNNYLLDEGIQHSDKELTEEKVLEKAWNVVKPIYENEIQEIVERYEQAHAKGMASDNINEIGKKAIQANIEIALISSDKSIPGKLNQVDGTIIEGSIKNPNYDDVLDDMAQEVIDKGGSVVVLTEEEMPTDKGIAVIFRY